MNSDSKPEKNSEINEIPDLKLKKRYQKSLAILIVGITIIFIWVVLIGVRVLNLFGIDTLAIIILGIIISLYGLYATIANKLQLDWQRRIIFRRIFSGSIVLIIGVIFLSIGLWMWYFYGQIGGLSWAGGLPFFSVIMFTTFGAILMILGSIRSSLAARSYLAERKKKLS